MPILGFSFFTTGANGGASWDGRRLRIDFTHTSNLPETHLDLLWDEANQTWRGRFDRGLFRAEAITLRRPAFREHSMLTGTWYEHGVGSHTCLHIAQAADGSFTGWSDALQVPGQLRFANGLKPPEHTLEQYGVLAKVRPVLPDRVDVELWAYYGLCCPHPFTASLAPGGASLIGEWTGRMNDVPRPAHWVRVPGDSCIAAASQR